MSILESLQRIKEDLPPGVEVLAATKSRSIGEIGEVEKYVSCIGENYVQEAEEKYEFVKGKVPIHLIGHLQKNKVNRALKVFDMIQTVDNLEIAHAINERTERLFPILLQVNIGEEEQKQGCHPEEAYSLIKEVSLLKNVRVFGLMALTPFSEDPENSRPYFKRMKQLFVHLKREQIPHVDMRVLSMGMSNDYKIAIEEGSTLIRLGTHIFGKRS